MNVQAVNNSVFVLLDEPEREVGGLLMTSEAVKKPNRGTVLSVGDLVGDKKIRASKGRKVLFHEGCGQTYEVDGETFLSLEDKMIIGIL